MADDGGSAELPTGTVTFLFTDIVGSTPLWDSFPDAMGPALARHDEIVRAAIGGAGGHVISTSGDSFVAVFARAGLAVEAALCAQRALTAEVWAGGPVLRVRMGIHTGDAEERDGDYFGPPLNRAARIMAAANGGQIVLSALTAGLVSGVSEFEFHDLGLVQLKGVVEPVHVVGVAGDGHAWIDTPLLTTQVSRGNLPRLQTEMVGDLADLQRRVANLARARVVTLTGSGGVGKTRAAIEIGWLVVDEFVDGVWLVELGPIADGDLVLTGIASVLGVRPQPGMTVVDSIVDWCYGRRMLLVLDNCEHVLDPVAEITAAIVAGCPTVTIVATSREPLGVDGEIVVRIPSLEETYGIELFVMRATAADSSFEPTDADREVIAVICRRLDGIPLAIELAAARIRSLTPTELLARLDDRFRLLRGGGRGGLERHRTLRATVDWSYQLLSSDEQLLFDRLSVFAGTFDLAAAEAICAGDGLDDTDIVDLLGDLVDKSMVIAVRSQRGTRYRLLETLRQYGEERLDERGATATLRDAHLAYFCALAEQIDRQWNSPDQAIAGIRFDDDWDNMGAAHNWSISTADIDASTALVAWTGEFATCRVRRDHQEWCNRTREMAESHGVAPMRISSYEALWASSTATSRRLSRWRRTGSMMTTTVVLLSVTGCWPSCCWRRAEHPKPSSSLRCCVRVLDTTSDPFARSVLASGIAQTTAGHPDAEADIQVFLDSALVVGTDQLAHAIRIRGSQRLFVDNDVDAALTDMREAIRLTKSVGTTSIWAEQGVAITLILGARPEARRELRRIIAAAYDERIWLVVDSLLELPPSVLSTTDPEAAAVVFGYCERRPAWGDAARQWREHTAELMAATPDSAAIKARGAAMDRHEIVAFTLAARRLAQVSSPSRCNRTRAASARARPLRRRRPPFARRVTAR